jgi:peptide deformylase
MVLEIVKYGDPVLRAKGKPADPADRRIAVLAEEMIETMYAAHGLGLAAQQVGLPLQLTVIDVAQVQQDRPSTMSVGGALVDLQDWMPLILLNPRLELGAERVSGSEGCLSFPEIHGDVPRASAIKVRAQKLDGSELIFEATGMLARALQHEVDHLQGVLFIDRMNSAAKASLSGRLKRLQKEGAANPTNGKTRPAKAPKELEPSPAEG